MLNIKILLKKMEVPSLHFSSYDDILSYNIRNFNFSDASDEHKNLILSIWNREIVITEDEENHTKLLFEGLYHGFVTKNYEKTEMYLTNAILYGDRAVAYFYLGNYHQFVTKKYNKMKYFYEKCLLSANPLNKIEDIYNNFSFYRNAINYNFGCYYKYIEKDYDKMKYYFDRIREGTCYYKLVTLQLGHYYSLEKNYVKMEEIYKQYLKKYKSGTISRELGYYYSSIKDYDKMIEFYNLSIEKNSSLSMIKLGYYYQYINIDYSEMERLYNLAINTKKISKIQYSFCESIVMVPNDKNYLVKFYSDYGYYHQTITKNYDEMENHYNYCVEHKYALAIVKFGHHHQFITKNHEKMIELYKLAIELENTDAMYNLGFYYGTIHNEIEMKKYLLMSISYGKDKSFISNKYSDEEIYEYLKDNIHSENAQILYDELNRKINNLDLIDEIKNELNKLVQKDEICKHLYYLSNDFKQNYTHIADYTIVVNCDKTAVKYYIHSFVIYYLNILRVKEIEKISMCSSYSLNVSSFEIMDDLINFLYLGTVPEYDNYKKWNEFYILIKYLAPLDPNDKCVFENNDCNLDNIQNNEEHDYDLCQGIIMPSNL